MPAPALTATSYIVLGLLEAGGPATPYELKARVAGSVGNFWSVPHSQIYAEPERLLERGLVELDAEETGRRRKVYAVNDAGRAALAAWRDDPPGGLGDMRYPGLLALFFGADPAQLAERHLPAHEAKLAEYQQLAAAADSAPRAAGLSPGPRLALESGLRHERVWIEFWRDVRDGRIA